MMDTSTHSLSCLFAQLGLPNKPEDIEAFLVRHGPLPQAEILANAEIWTESQKTFLHEAFKHDSDWSDVVDELNLRLRD